MTHTTGSPDVAQTSVVAIDPIADARWDEYARGHAGASAYHLGAWARILRRAYGFTPVYRALEEPGGRLAGILPLMHTRGPLTGSRLRSLPVVPPPSGPLADSREGLARLLRAACEITRERGASVWTCQSRDPGLEELHPGLHVAKRKTPWIAELPADPDELRARLKRHSKNLHRSLNKADAAGLDVREGLTRDDLKRFYRLYLETMREHRALPRRLRQMALDRALLGPSGATRIFLVEHRGQTIAGGLFHAFGNTVELLYNGSDRSSLDLRPNHALYWHVMRWAIEQGLTRFDFGDAPPDSSLGRFKAQWASEPGVEFSYTWSANGGDTRADAARRAGGQVGGGGDDGVVARVWQRAPLAATRLAGAVAYRL